MLTPEQLKEHRFEKLPDGNYNSEEVNLFFGEVIAFYNQMFRENGELLRKITVLANKIVEYKNDEDNIRNALLNAQRTAESVLQDAGHEAEMIIASANNEAAVILDDAHAQTENIINGRDGIITEASQTADEIKTMVKAEAEDIISAANEQAGAIKEAAKLEAVKVLTHTNTESEEILSKAKSDADEMILKAKAKAEGILNQARLSLDGLLVEAETEPVLLEEEQAAKIEDGTVFDESVFDEAKKDIVETEEVAETKEVTETEEVAETEEINKENAAEAKKNQDIELTKGETGEGSELSENLDSDKADLPIIEILHENLLMQDDIVSLKDISIDDGVFSTFDIDEDEEDDLRAEAVYEQPEQSNLEQSNDEEISDLDEFSQAKADKEFKLNINDPNFDSYDNADIMGDVAESVSDKISKMISEKQEDKANNDEFFLDFSVFEEDGSQNISQDQDAHSQAFEDETSEDETFEDEAQDEPPKPKGFFSRRKNK